MPIDKKCYYCGAILNWFAEKREKPESENPVREKLFAFLKKGKNKRKKGKSLSLLNRQNGKKRRKIRKFAQALAPNPNLCIPRRDFLFFLSPDTFDNVKIRKEYISRGETAWKPFFEEIEEHENAGFRIYCTRGSQHVR